MILKALYDYYHRCGDLPPEGMELKEIAFVIVIDEAGNFVRIEDNRIDKKRCHAFMVMRGSRSGTTPKPYLFWDNVEYVLNYTKNHEPLSESDSNDENKVAEREKEIGKSQNKHDALIKHYESISKRFPSNKSFRAVCEFYSHSQLEQVKEDPLWTEIAKKPTVNISFRLNGCNEIVAENSDLLQLVADSHTDDTHPKNEHVCLVSGEYGELVESTSPSAIPSGQPTGGRLVAFQVNQGYDSYGKNKCFNAPISKASESAYTTALKTLLAKESRNKFFIGNRTFLFWASSNSEAAKKTESCYGMLFDYSPTDDNDDPNAGVEQVRKVFESIYLGILHVGDDEKFYILGLSPNSARIAVVYWQEIGLKEFAGNILKHFQDMEIIDNRKDKRPYSGLRDVLRASLPNANTKDVQPNLPETVMKSIMHGTPYPYSLYMACLKRIRAMQNVGIGQASIIKAYLNRSTDFKNNKKIDIMLDKENSNCGYLCGRLFAILERLQLAANDYKNSNIGERYMNAASATPATVFPTLLNLSVHHAEKLDGGPNKTYLEKLKGEVIDRIPAEGFPSHLDLTDQGRFMVGYYHQRQEFFKPKGDK